jgi:thioredoxin-like negative regulator of GroEL
VTDRSTVGAAHGASDRRHAEGRTPPADDRPCLLFFVERTSGPSRRMRGLVASLEVTRKDRLRVVEVDMDEHPDLARRLGVAAAPTLVLVSGGRPAARLDGRVTGKQIDGMLQPFMGF